MKNLSYLFVVLLCVGSFSLEAQKRDARDHPIVQTNDGDIIGNVCLGIIDNQSYEHTKELGFRYNLDENLCTDVFEKLYLVAFDTPSYQGNILGYSAVHEGTNDPYGIYCNASGDLLDLQLVSLTLSDLYLPCPLPNTNASFNYYVAIMLLENDLFVPLFLAGDEDYACVEDLFPSTCFDDPQSFGFRLFGFCYSCVSLSDLTNSSNDDSALQQKAQLNNQQAFSLEVSPNPFSDQINVQIQSLGAARGAVDLLDLQGRIISSQVVDLSEGVNDLSLSGVELPEGLYFLQLKSNESVQTLKIIKGNR
ncbi:MAG: T9SS type A sorting domain-containing protein [Bacteroidota bacterium]